MPPSPLLSVVIPTHDRKAILAKALDALDAQTFSDYEIVVVDDGSSDGTFEMLEARAARSERLTVLRQENAGQGSARNHALRHARGELVLFLGDDILASPTLVEEHVAAHARHGDLCAVVGFIDWRRSEMKVTPALEFVNREGHQFGFGHMKPGAEVSFAHFYTSNLSLPRSVLGETPFDPSFRLYGWEDIELGYRLGRAGVKLFYESGARAEHLHPMTLRDLFARQRRVGEAFADLLRLHPELASRPEFTRASLPRWFGIGKRVVPPLVPLLAFLDGVGVPLGKRGLHCTLITGYFLGLEEAAAKAG